jgi:hypothetical protein
LEHLEDRLVPAVFNVNSLADILNPGPGVVTLRSAIQQANATPGGNTINLTVPGDYRITLLGTPGETDNADGEFSILPTGGNLTIVNTSGGKVSVDAGGHSRVFDINPNFDPANPTAKFTVTMQGFTVENGFVTDAANPDGPNASGGGIRDIGNASLTLLNVLVTDNTATADGGGVAMENTVSVPWTLSLTNTTISNNRAGDAGGGIDTDGSGKVFVTNSTITGNTSVNQGAGIWLDAIQVGTLFQTANLTVTGTLLNNNSAMTAMNLGGGIAGNGTVTLTADTLANNFVDGVGGGFGDENAQGTLIILNSTIVSNSAIGNGGGIEASGPTTTINDSTITGNITQTQGGGIAVTSVPFTLNNTIVADNFSNATAAMNFQGTAPDVLAAVQTGNGNFIGIGDANLTGITNGMSGNQIGTAAAPLGPLLGPLQLNAGPTPTRVPLPGSPVINTGIVTALPAGTTADQRGYQRVVNNMVDIGAVEVGTVMSAQERFVQALYLDELGRTGSIGELDAWVAILNGPGGSQALVASEIQNSFEGRDHIVKGWYQTFLGRQTFNNEEFGWVNLLANHTEEQVLSLILSSGEFYARAQTLVTGGTPDQNYIQALYNLLLNRTAGANEIAGWINILPQLGRQGVVIAFLQSQAYRTIQIGDDYTMLLHRAADQVGVSGWLASNLDLAKIRQGFESSQEFFTNG